MGLRKLMSALAVLVVLAVTVPAFAHEDHKGPATASVAAAPMADGHGSAMAAMPGMTAEMDHGGMVADAAPRTIPQRLVRWLGAMHPAAVHFPIALFLFLQTQAQSGSDPYADTYYAVIRLKYVLLWPALWLVAFLYLVHSARRGVLT